MKYMIRKTGKAWLLLFLLPQLIWGQRFTHRQYRHDWSDHVEVDIPVSPRYRPYGAVILYEDVIISLVSPVFKRYARIKFQTREGIDQFNDFVLPHPSDPYYFQYHFPVERQDSTYFPVLAEDQIFYFDARIIRNGELVKAVLDERIYPFSFWQGRAHLTYYSFRYHVRNLQPGDELEISYSHKLMDVHRYFFNEIIPKQESQVSIKIPYPITQTVRMRNFSMPYDSSENTRNSIPYRTYGYHLNQMDAVNPLFGAQAYNQLPYLEFFEDRYYPENASILNGDPIPVKFTWPARLYSLSNYRPAFDYDYYRNKMDNATLTYNEVADSIFLPFRDSSLTATVRHMQEVLLDKFSFANDFAYFTGQNTELETVYRNLGANIIRERWAQETWKEMFYRLARDYYLAFIPDKRIYRINPTAYSKPLDANLCYAIQENNQVHFITPRRHNFGYYMDELPFYLSGVTTFLIPQMVPETTYTKHPELIGYPLAKTTVYKAEDNRRNTSTYARVSLDSGRVSFSSKVELSGQFSTMTRGGYLFAFRDSTVNKKYNQRLLDIPSGVVDKQELVSLSRTYPFACTLGLLYHSDRLVERKNDTLYTIDLTGCTNFVYQQGLDTFYHHADYYPDFQGEDRFSIGIRFSSPVRVLNSADFIYLFDNSFARLTCNLFQPREDFVVLEARYTVQTDRVYQQDLTDVVNIFRALHKLSNLRMIISVQPSKN